MEVIRLVKGDDAAEARVRFAGTDPVFAGHFPHAPVLPGVDLIDAAVCVVSRLMKRPLRLQRLSSVKFCTAVLPEQEIRFTFKSVEEPDGSGRVKVAGRWLRGEEKVAEMTFTAAPFEQEGGVA